MINEDEENSPTALIPFCEFGGNVSAMGVKIDQLDVPVCNSFKAKIVKDQLCYEVDPNNFKHNIALNGELSLSLFIDFNEDRGTGDFQSFEPFITINTIGRTKKFFFIIQKFILEPIKLVLERIYFFDAIKEIAITDSFFDLDENKIGCQKESIADCSTRKYLKDLMNKCQCLPFEIRLDSKVIYLFMPPILGFCQHTF